jgi:hyperosmotically inducible periplasmic protein
MKQNLTTIVFTVILSTTALVAAIAAPKAGNLEVLAPHQRLAIQQSNRAGNQTTRERVRAYLRREVRHELVMLPYYGVFDWLEFEVQGDGDVILQGQVTRPTLKSDAQNVVKRIEGVERVINRIEVLPLSPNDDRIRRAVYRTLFNINSPLHRYGLGAVPSIHIIVKNGHVTLKGVVGSQADRNIANIRANGVPDVFSVTNRLTISDNRRR